MKLTKLINAVVGMCAVVGLAACVNSSSGDGSVDLLDYIAVQESEDGNWGFYAPDGTIKFADEFKNQPTAVLNGFFSVKEGKGYTIYKFGDKLEPVKDAEGLVSVGAMTEGLIPAVFPKERISFLNKDGEKVFTLEPYKGKEIVACAGTFSEGLMCVTTEDNLYGFINTKGEMVIEPKYAGPNNFYNGYALMLKPVEDGEDPQYAVIDTKGETVFTLRKNMTPVSDRISHGYLLVKDNNDHYVFLDTKGEKAYTCPSKAKYVTDYNDKYMTFANEDGDWGIMDFEFNTIIRPKYRNVMIVDGNRFLAVAEDGEATLFNSEAEEQLRISDYGYVGWLSKWGYLARDKKTVSFLDKEGKPIKNAEFTDINLIPFTDARVSSDYFNIGAVVNDVCELITDKGVDKYEIGEAPSVHFSNPSEYYYTSRPSVDLSKSGYRYTITVQPIFNMSMGDYSYNYNGYDYTRSDYWRPGCELETLELTISTATEWGNDGSEAITRGLEKKGFEILTTTGKKATTYVALLRKGNIIVLVSSESGASTGRVAIGAYNAMLVEHLKSQINLLRDDDDDTAVGVEEAAEEAADSCAVVEAVEADSYYD